MYATVLLSNRQAGIRNGLTYKIPESLHVQVGQLVCVPLRKSLIEGLVIGIEKSADDSYDIKEVDHILSPVPLLSHQQIHVMKWIAEYYYSSLRQVASVYLPGLPWSKLLPVPIEYVRLSPSVREERKWGKKQLEVLEYLQGKEWVTLKSLREELSVSTSVLNRLFEYTVVEKESRLEEAIIRDGKSCILHTPTLTPTQSAIYKAMLIDKRPSLLFGVTGSGKTEVYAAMIEKTLCEEKSAILLLPEILLTENFIERFQQLVDRDAIAVIHSRLTLTQRRTLWRRIRSGDVRFVIGSRSALFAPVQNLGLIVIDEEHEWTYKNEQTPRYHATNVAQQVAEKYGAKLVLGSATPSIESWYKAQKDEYQMVELPERYGSSSLPSVQVIDLGSVKFNDYYPLSPTLVQGIRTRLEKNEQTVLFLNRRGFATSLLCMDCRYCFEDPDSQLPYTVHHRKGQPYLISHHTGQEYAIPANCPSCGATNLQQLGAGTQRVESILETLFPDARIIRADRDSMKHPEQMRLILKNMQEGRADILLGTQSVVKGLDLPNVTLAAVLLADVGLSLPHFRAGERVFQLLTQLTGRSGRRSTPGEVIIQTYRPDAVEVKLSAAHAVREYLIRECEVRVKASYPPDTQLIRLVFAGEGSERESRSAVDKYSKIEGITVSRTPSLFRGNSVWYVFLRGDDARSVLKKIPCENATVDVDPIECL